MKKNICFIVNPISGVGKQKVIEELTAKHLDKTLFDYKIVYTKAPKHATALAREAAENNYDIVVVVGGDGSVNEVAKGLIGTNTAMALLPTGSGNGLARHLNIPLDLVKAIDLINKGKEKSIDTIHFNEETFVNVAGIGFDAYIGWEFAKYGKRGFSSYVKIVFKEFRKYLPQEYEFIIAGKSITKKAFLVSFANGSQWGNNACIAPTAKVDDGRLKISILKPFRWWNTINIGYRLFNKTLHHSKHLEIIDVRDVTVQQKGTTAHIDGEPITIGNTIHIKVNPASLKVIV